MKWKMYVICAVILLALCALPAGAAEFPESEEKYIVVALDDYNSTPKAAPITGTIQQGETCVYTYQVPAGKSKLEVHLEWTAGTANDLSLKIYTPADQALGSYYDGFDGQDDNKVRIGIIKNPLQNGEWTFEISGSQVSGTESFSLTINAT
ncbi:MAG: hypothetical protein O0X93_06770 [Methanocorpusculum sp.]|nr:hypothetical protein [Methanocorpusculum sp.]MDE2519095.1 hypothetical protein [Methanocorpusculum sp.]MDE2522848.1 hypothetical protein [Methanocorpusculum sp.]MDE2523625.1 hypothetical protein [Methanocorpusculum sp.]